MGVGSPSTSWLRLLTGLSLERRPAVMATRRNLAISLNRLAGATNAAAAAARHLSRHPNRVLPLNHHDSEDERVTGRSRTPGYARHEDVPQPLVSEPVPQQAQWPAGWARL